jgi:hypothetical protein
LGTKIERDVIAEKIKHEGLPEKSYSADAVVNQPAIEEGGPER